MKEEECDEEESKPARLDHNSCNDEEAVKEEEYDEEEEEEGEWDENDEKRAILSLRFEKTLVGVVHEERVGDLARPQSVSTGLAFGHATLHGLEAVVAWCGCRWSIEAVGRTWGSPGLYDIGRGGPLSGRRVL